MTWNTKLKLQEKVWEIGSTETETVWDNAKQQWDNDEAYIYELLTFITI